MPRFTAVALVVALAGAALGQKPPRHHAPVAAAGRPEYISFGQARQVLQVFSDDLPSELRGLSPQQLQERWPQFVRRHDAETRARLRRGDEDSLANLLLYGTSFTRQPRITLSFLEQADKAAASGGTNPAMQAFLARVDDFIHALNRPGGNERVVQMSSLLRELGYKWDSPSEQARLRQYLLGDVARLRKELDAYEKRIEAARATGDVNQEFATRSTVFQDRGVSLDTSLMPDFALEEALQQLRDHALLPKGSVRRVAVVGPGLDFADKREGYDFYPLQSTQPFLVMDSLVRLKLATPAALRVTTLDISARVNQHFQRARQRAQEKQSYTLELPLDSSIAWKPTALAFWRRAGLEIGAPAAPVQPPDEAGKLQMRAVRVPANTVLRVTPLDLNVVWQRLPLPPSEQYDLVVATNILVYYNEFEQALALANLQQMIRPGGLLLTNNGLPEVPALKMKQLGHSTTEYSSRPGDGDHIIWYQHAK